MPFVLAVVASPVGMPVVVSPYPLGGVVVVPYKAIEVVIVFLHF